MERTQTPEEFVERWDLVPVAQPFSTPTSILQAVERDGKPCMLKIATHPEEAMGMQSLAWWDGDGAVQVLEQSPVALLMERPNGARSLTAMANGDQDELATRVLCCVLGKLHGRDHVGLPAGLTDLGRWFESLSTVSPPNSLIALGQETANRLLRNQQDPRVLHGDMHHENVLDGESRGWLAIDPKGLYGDRVFDYVNILRNPMSPRPLEPGRFSHHLDIIVEQAGIDRIRLLQWTLAFCALSATWILTDGDEPTLDLAIARLAASELGHVQGVL